MKLGGYIPLMVYIVIIAAVSQMVYIVNGMLEMMRNDRRGRKLQKKRIRAGITQEELAAFSGIPVWKINHIEHGDECTVECYKVLLWAINEYSNPC